MRPPWCSKRLDLGLDLLGMNCNSCFKVFLFWMKSIHVFLPFPYQVNQGPQTRPHSAGAAIKRWGDLSWSRFWKAAHTFPVVGGSWAGKITGLIWKFQTYLNLSHLPYSYFLGGICSGVYSQNNRNKSVDGSRTIGNFYKLPKCWEISRIFPGDENFPEIFQMIRSF